MQVGDLVIYIQKNFGGVPTRIYKISKSKKRYLVDSMDKETGKPKKVWVSKSSLYLQSDID